MGDILFTSTTYLSKPNKFTQIKKALNSFFEVLDTDKISKFIIINEFSKDPEDNVKIQYLQRQFPFIKIINKNESQQGQAKSLNLIIDELKSGNYKYWINWEESWQATRPFLNEAYFIMENSDIDQLSFLKEKFSNKQRKIGNFDYKEQIKLPLDNYSKNKSWNKYNFRYWPLFSLRPSIIRVSSVLKTGYFNEDKKKWPITFEYEWGIDWLHNNNAKKGWLENYAAERQPGHVSTYNNWNKYIIIIIAIIAILLLIITSIILYKKYKS